ncbi:SDR family NAD(P)-dependent oxidoreductase [Rugosimonospora africana]|uniref:Dehydrogenase n=1 Tax=Rugosimonospora africana TaxID=556532 RepID=A0A8J3VRB3_9ACTN|nr:SDR family NAD(P)-dependent oxidoreductase [Rugosimonospora africana]GIH15371.1 dehydrogenase [Rugosimonospora africana]
MLTHARTRRVALVTGATHGIGYQVARGLAEDGATVIVHARTHEDAYLAMSGLLESGVDPLLFRSEVADFTRLSDVRALAARIISEHGRVDLLVNNAAVIGDTRRVVTGDGYESTFQVNYLAHYLLTRLLWRSLRDAPHGRVVSVSSAVHRGAHVGWGESDRSTRHAPVAAYAQSKLALTMLTQAVATRASGGMTAVSVHPGVIATGTMRRVYGTYGAPVADGAEAVLRLCAASSAVRNGGYYEGRMLAMPSALAQDPGSVDRLWRLSARMAHFAGDPAEQAATTLASAR